MKMRAIFKIFLSGLFLCFSSFGDEIYMPDLKRAVKMVKKKVSLPEYFRSPQSDFYYDCPPSEYDQTWALELGVEDLITKIFLKTISFVPWCNGQEGGHQFGDAYTGGFISSTAQVDPTVIIGPMASVCDNSIVKGLVKVCGRVEIRGGVILEGDLEIHGRGKITPFGEKQ